MLDDLLQRLRKGMAQNAGLASALAELERAIAAHYGSDAPCC
jgi:hypothetical protein